MGISQKVLRNRSLQDTATLQSYRQDSKLLKWRYGAGKFEAKAPPPLPYHRIQLLHKLWSHRHPSMHDYDLDDADAARSADNISDAEILRLLDETEARDHEELLDMYIRQADKVRETSERENMIGPIRFSIRLADRVYLRRVAEIDDAIGIEIQNKRARRNNATEPRNASDETLSYLEAEKKLLTEEILQIQPDEDARDLRRRQASPLPVWQHERGQMYFRDRDRYEANVEAWRIRFERRCQ